MPGYGSIAATVHSVYRDMGRIAATLYRGAMGSTGTALHCIVELWAVLHYIDVGTKGNIAATSTLKCGAMDWLVLHSSVL